MILDIYQVDAFADEVFTGNPAAVVPLENWLDDNKLQAIAQENNLAETAFFVVTEDHIKLRWFTPTNEVDLCGHATMASAHVLFEHLGWAKQEIHFSTRSGALIVSKQDNFLCMDFPSQAPTECDMPEALIKGLRLDNSVDCYKSEDFIVVLKDRESVLAVQPDFSALLAADLRGVIVTAKDNKFDFVARFFGPKVGVPEDSVTGSAYTQLTPLWSTLLSKTQFTARQVAKRGGNLACELNGNRVVIKGKAITYLKGQIFV